MNRRIIGVVISIVLAGVGTWALVQYVRQADERAISGQEAVEVLVVAEPVPQGASLEEVADSVTTKLIPLSSRADDSVSTLEAVEGQVTSVDLVPGEQVLASRFVEAAVLQESQQVDVPEGLLEVTIAVSPERAVGGDVNPGDLVAFVASFDPFTLDAVEPDGTENLAEFLDRPTTEEGTEPVALKTPNTTHITVHKALVTRVQVGSAADADPEGEDSLAPKNTLLVTLAVEAPEVERIVFAAEFGSIWLALEQADSPETNTEIITRGNVYR